MGGPPSRSHQAENARMSREQDRVPDALPDTIGNVDALEELLSRPDAILRRELIALDGDIMVPGVGGKMGPSLAHMAKPAVPEKRGVARFTEKGLRDALFRY